MAKSRFFRTLRDAPAPEEGKALGWKNGALANVPSGVPPNTQVPVAVQGIAHGDNEVRFEFPLYLPPDHGPGEYKGGIGVHEGPQGDCGNIATYGNWSQTATQDYGGFANFYASGAASALEMGPVGPGMPAGSATIQIQRDDALALLNMRALGGEIVLDVGFAQPCEVAIYGAGGATELHLNPVTGCTDNGNPLGRKVAVPATATDPGRPGDFACGGGFAYFCTAANTWVRCAVAGW